MIRSKKQYNITKKHLTDFTEHLKELQRIGKEDFIHPIIHQARKDAVQSQIDIFIDDIMEWEKSKVYSEEEVRDIAWYILTAGSDFDEEFALKQKFNNRWEQSTR